jgi:hypothetical protein
VLETIQDRYVKGRPIDIAGFGDKRLASAAKRRFGSWPAAVAAAGLSDKLAPRKPARNWTPEAVLQAIQTWHDQGRLISNVSKQDQGLYSAAKHHFGGWRAAVAAAGLKPTRRRWSKELVIEEIRSRHQHGLMLNSGIVSQQDPPLAGAAVRMFGNWGKALLAAGIPGNLPQRKTA